MNQQILIDTYGLKGSQQDLKAPPNPQEVKTAEAWIKIHCHRIKTVSRKSYSYWLKHRAERWGAFLRKHFESEEFAPYISNGAFIQAAMNLGYVPVNIDFSVNACFRMGVRLSNDFIE